MNRLTDQERLILGVRARLAGVHPSWVKWFTRADGSSADDDLRYVVDIVERQVHNYHVYLEDPAKGNNRVREYLEKRDADGKGY